VYRISDKYEGLRVYRASDKYGIGTSKLWRATRV
jgi:hypothetical protein